MMLLEITAHRIGGEHPEGYRAFGPRAVPVTRSAIERWELTGPDSARDVLLVQFSDWVPVDDEWLSCRVDLMDVTGVRLGLRPALVYSKPFDIPTHTLFQPRWPEYGAFSLGLRVVEE